jgi:hypothetical protein
VEALVVEGWGEALGVLVTSVAPPARLRARLRRLLMVKSESERTLYFRFYDPRVLRVFLPMATPRQVSTFFGGGEVGAFLAEAADARAALVFHEATAGVLHAGAIALSREAGGDHAVRG